MNLRSMLLQPLSKDSTSPSDEGQGEDGLSPILTKELIQRFEDKNCSRVNLNFLEFCNELAKYFGEPGSPLRRQVH